MKILKDLHTGRKKFSRVERMHFLQELEEELKVYYLSYTRRKSEDPDDVEEREERRKEQTDEIRLKHTNLYSYNPLSKKYKARKEELLRNLKREF